MISLPAGTRIWIVAGATDMRCGMHGLSARVQTALEQDPFSGQLFIFRGKRVPGHYCNQCTNGYRVR
jgi:transposase